MFAGNTLSRVRSRRVVLLEQDLVAAHPDVGGDVVGLGGADERVQEQAVHDLQRALLDVLVRAVDRVAGLEPDHALPAPLGERGPGLGRGQAVLLERRVRRQGQRPERAGHRERARRPSPPSRPGGPSSVVPYTDWVSRPRSRSNTPVTSRIASVVSPDCSATEDRSGRCASRRPRPR